MKKRRKSNAGKSILNISSSILALGSVIHPVFLAIPIINSVVMEVLNYFDDKSIEKRFKLLQDELVKKEIDIEKLQDKIKSMNEHQIYVLRNNLKHLCISALPETVDAFIKALIDTIVGENQEMSEEICEIIRQFNANDISLLKIIKDYLANGTRSAHQFKIQEYFKDQKEDKTFKDRNVIYSENTIMWDDFTNMCNLNVNEMGRMLNQVGIKENGEEDLTWTYLVRSLLKMQGLGILQTEYIATMGTISPNSVERIHITLFGQEILKYIEDDEMQTVIR